MTVLHTMFFIVTYVGLSMNPTFVDGDTLNVCGDVTIGCTYQDVKIGDVIVFYSYVWGHNDRLVVHRVIDIWHDYLGNTVLIRTQGDNTKTNPDCYEEMDYVTADEYRGLVTAKGELKLVL